MVLPFDFTDVPVKSLDTNVYAAIILCTSLTSYCIHPSSGRAVMHAYLTACVSQCFGLHPPYQTPRQQ